MASFTAYIISGPPDVPLTPENGYSQLLTAGNSVKAHSVPMIEAASGLLAVECLANILFNHGDDILSKDVPFEVHIQSDSECYLWSLDPNKIHKAVLLKNLCRSVHLILRDLSLVYQWCTFHYSYVESENNISDLNSKVNINPIQTLNSDLWRFGHDWFLSKDFPGSAIFLKIISGIPQWTPPAAAHDAACSKCAVPCTCLTCRWNDVTVESSDQNKQLIKMGTNHFIENTRWPKVKSDNHTGNP